MTAKIQIFSQVKKRQQNSETKIPNNRQAKWITKLGHAPTETYSRVYTEWIILLVHCITNKFLLYFYTMFGGTFGRENGNCTSYTKRSAFDRWVSKLLITNHHQLYSNVPPLTVTTIFHGTFESSWKINYANSVLAKTYEILLHGPQVCGVTQIYID